MASSKEVKMTLKLQVDTENNRVCYAEAEKDFVDFLFTLLSLPVGTIVRLLTGKSMVGCLENLYNSVENLSNIHMQPNQSKEVLLKPKVAVSLTKASFLRTDDDAAAPAVNKMYWCKKCESSVTYDQKATCPCKYNNNKYNNKWKEVTFVPSGEEGYVKDVIKYMVTDDLVVTPMPSTASDVIAMLKKFNVSNLESLKPKKVTFRMDEGLKLLKATLHSKMVLTSVFLGGMKTPVNTDAPASGSKVRKEQKKIRRRVDYCVKMLGEKFGELYISEGEE